MAIEDNTECVFVSGWVLFLLGMLLGLVMGIVVTGALVVYMAPEESSPPKDRANTPHRSSLENVNLPQNDVAMSELSFGVGSGTSEEELSNDPSIAVQELTNRPPNDKHPHSTSPSHKNVQRILFRYGMDDIGKKRRRISILTLFKNSSMAKRLSFPTHPPKDPFSNEEVSSVNRKVEDNSIAKNSHVDESTCSEFVVDLDAADVDGESIFTYSDILDPRKDYIYSHEEGPTTNTRVSKYDDHSSFGSYYSPNKPNTSRTNTLRDPRIDQ